MSMRIEYVCDLSADTPLVRIYDFTESELNALRAALGALADGTASFIKISGGASSEQISATTDARDRGLIRREDGELCWLLTSAAWADVRDRAASLDTTLPNAFQWLGEEGEISVLLSRTGQW
jgi:hypothetical protein